MFEFKQFVIKQDRTAMKVGTDGVLLGAWVGVRPSMSRILDIGSGTALVALMLAQRTVRFKARVVGVEVDSDAVEQSRENVANSPWSGRVTICEGAIQEFRSDEKFDLIVSNPPFFRSSLKSPDSKRSCARHADSLQLKDLVDAVKSLLHEEGRFGVVLPVEESRRLDLESCGVLFLQRRCSVVTREGDSPKRVLSEYGLVPPPGVIESKELHIYDGRGYSEEYVALTGEFYTKF